jgi:hypothetical protein
MEVQKIQESQCPNGIVNVPVYTTLKGYVRNHKFHKNKHENM